jgi:hypothetical protein
VRTGDVAQVLSLLSKCEAVSSNPNTVKTNMTKQKTVYNKLLENGNDGVSAHF